MNVRHVLWGAMLVVLAGCQHSLVRDTMPTVTRTGEVKDIVIREELSDTTVNANPGDEIRWINKRQGDVRVIFLAPVMEMFTCQRNFGSFMGANKNEYSANLGPNETASVCFRSPAEIKYVVRAKSDLPSGEQNIAGTINIQNPDRASGRGTDKEPTERRAAHADEGHMSTR